jgi:DNA-binding MarR family transcriptional regulator
MEEIVPVLERAATEGPGPDRLAHVGSVILDRTLHLLREASREQILEECVALQKFLEGPGRQHQERSPEVYGSWTGLSQLLAEAARRSDRAALESILLGHKGLGRKVMETLAERGGPVPRTEVREKLALSESHLSHLLRDLDEADLIVRHRPRGTREILIELGPAGRELVQRSIVPAWVEAVLRRLNAIREGTAASEDAGSLENELVEKGAPSHLAARRLAAALAATHGEEAAAAANARRLIEQLSVSDTHFGGVWAGFPGRPVAAFGRAAASRAPGGRTPHPGPPPS